ncbi:acyl CoA binding protein [Ancylostoma ceylanicum]|uniref:Acyl CoA binding protein n=1 Tax=Ancylostoma ceylanicum TaxID=53326 RepID=A0A0D6LWH2_9BILA|nr:acyl CoA binding protein [Ancylostoma ceylanicum]
MEMAPSLFTRSGESQNVDDKFLAAVEIVQNMPKDGRLPELRSSGPVTTTTNEKLAFYSLYKQATVGPCNTLQPPFWDVVARYKWDAWNNLGSMDPSQAKATYINKVLRKVLLVSREHDIEEWMQSELFEKLLPKFTTLGLRPSVRKNRHQSSIEEGSDEPISRPEAVDEEEHNESRTRSPSESATSCADYEDDDGEGRRSRASHREDSFDELDSPHRDRSDSVLKKYTHKIEDELRVSLSRY